jgi:TRAP-type uncharacterized transport system substrate-binding protein
VLSQTTNVGIQARAFAGIAPIYLHAGVVQLCKEMGVQVPAKVIPPEYKK